MKHDWDRRLVAGTENSFDIMRLALATLVIFEHSYFLPINSQITEPLFRFSGGKIHFGAFAVDFFFVISGFLITRSWELTDNLSRFMQKRIARIVPGYLLASCIGVAIGALSVANINDYLRGINYHVFLLKILSLHQAEPPGAFPHNPMTGIVVGTLWSIRYEFDCYLMVAFFGLMGWLRRGLVSVVFLVLCAAYAAQQFEVLKLPNWDTGIPAILFSNPNQWPRLFTYFFAGSAFYLWRSEIPKSPVVFVLALLMVVLALRYGNAELALIFAGTYCVFFICLSFAAMLRIFGNKVDISYGAYLFGFPIQQLIISYLVAPISPLQLFALSFSITCCIAYLSWTFIESPCIHWKWPSVGPHTRPENHRI